MALDFGVHQRIGEHRLIAFVMAKAPVADNIKHHISVEFLTEFRGHFGGVDYRLRVIPIDVKNRRFNHQGDVSGIGAGAAEMWCCGKTNLVVNHNMHGATSFMANQS